MSRWFIVYLLAVISGTLTGCKTADFVLDNKEVIAHAAAETGIRLIAYSVAKNNPELAPAIYEISSLLMDIDHTLSPDGVNSLVESHIDNLDIGDLEASDLRLITYELIRIYSRVYTVEGQDLTSAEMQELFRELAVAIRTGAMMAGARPGDQPVESGNGLVQLSRIQIEIQ